MHNFKRIIIIILFIIVCLGINSLLNYILIPNNYIRVNVHNIETNSYDDIFVGTSHGFAAINPIVVDSVTGRKSTNICSGGEYLRDSYYLIKDACRKKTPKRVIYELDPGYWVNPDTENQNYALTYNNMSWSFVKGEYFFAKITSSDFRSALFPWFQYRQQYSAIPTNIKNKQMKSYKKYNISAFNEAGQALQKEGFMSIRRHEGFKTKENLILWDETKILKEVPKYFDRLVNLCKDRDIELVVITTPIPKETLEEYSKVFENANNYFSNLMDEYDIPYYNFNYIESKGFDQTIQGYSDYEGHMFGDNADAFSKILGEYLTCY